MSEESFKQVFSKFFPSFSSSTGSYAHHVFSCMDNTGSGSVNFEQFLSTLALLTHGSYDERVAWIFRLYDVNKDGSICRGDLEEITASVSNTTQRSSEDQCSIFRSSVSSVTRRMWWWGTWSRREWRLCQWRWVSTVKMREYHWKHGNTSADKTLNYISLWWPGVEKLKINIIVWSV